MSDAYLEARRQAILDAATAVFFKKGISAATMADIADEAGLTAGAIYRYFRSKDELADTCLGAVASAIARQWVEPPTAANTHLDFARLARATFTLMAAPGAVTSTVMQLESVLNAVRDHDTGLLATHREQQRRICEGVAQYISAGQARGEIAPQADPNVLAEALYMFYQGACMSQLVNPNANPVRHLDELIRLLEVGSSAASGSKAGTADH